MSDRPSPGANAEILSQVFTTARHGMLEYDALSIVGGKLAEAGNLELAEQLYDLWTQNTSSGEAYKACADIADLYRNKGLFTGAERWYRRSLHRKPNYLHAITAITAVRRTYLGTNVAWPFRIHNIELTNRCPMKCVMCPRTTSMTREQGFMAFDVFRSIVDQFVECSPALLHTEVVWLHHFGESLTHPEFDTFINYAADRGLRVGLSVNPIMIKGSVARRLLASRPEVIYASLDGHDDESFARIRGIDNAYETSKRNLLDLLAKKAELGWNTKVVVSMINFPMNSESIDRLKAYWEEQPGVDEFLMKDFTAWSGDVEDIAALTPDSAQSTPFPVFQCMTPWMYLSIAWDGDVVPCCFDYDKKYVLGNVRTQGLNEIWNGQPMQKLREEFLSGGVTNPLCQGCPSL